MYLSVFNVLKSTRLTPLGMFNDFMTSAETKLQKQERTKSVEFKTLEKLICPKKSLHQQVKGINLTIVETIIQRENHSNPKSKYTHKSQNID